MAEPNYIEDFIAAIKQEPSDGNRTFRAVVTRIDRQGTVWVRIAGSETETPTATTASEVETGDSINVEWRNNRLYIAGNITNPSAGVIRVDAVERSATQARNAATSAMRSAQIAGEAADKALGFAQQLSEAVEGIENDVEGLTTRVDTAEEQIETIESDITELEDDVTTAQGDITAIQGNITTLQSDVSTAQVNITTIQGNITTLQSDVTTAQGNITTIQGNIATLQDDVADAQDDIDDALEGLALAENVIGTLNWLTAHSRVTTDTTPTSGKSYYIRNQDGTFTLVTDTTGKSPASEGWYEMDEAISNYVAAHLSLTDYGLNLTLDNTSYRIHIGTLTASGDDGVYIIDGEGCVVTFFGESIEFDEDLPFHIGNENNYILWNPTQNRIEIGGNVLMGSNKTLSEVLAEINGTFIFDTTYTMNGTIASFEAHLYKGGVDVKEYVDNNNEPLYPAEMFTWYLKHEDSQTQEGDYIGSGYRITVDLSTCNYGAEVIAHFTTTEDSPLLNGNDDNLTDANGNNLTGRTESGESVRVRDLTVSTTLAGTDKLMVVGSEDEHLVSISTLQAYLNANLDKQVKFNTTAGWNAQTSLVSEANTLYIYTDHQTDSQGNPVAGIKAGDGNAYVVDLPFTDAIETEHIADTTRHITASERNFWNNKVRCYYASGDELIFTTA